MMSAKILSASEFKAKCLSCLTEIEQVGEPIMITRRGRPIAVLGPVNRPALKSSRDSWARKGRILGDIIDTSDIISWESNK
jgi:antitoxin (DNA-binding transcriptional repressor) of toxin-antitoxin stability system